MHVLLRVVRLCLFSIPFLLATAFSARAAAKLPVSPFEGVDYTVVPSGVITFQGMEIALRHFAPDWSSGGQEKLEVEAGYPKKTATAWETRGTLAVKGGVLSIEETLTRQEGGGMAVVYRATHPTGLTTQELSAEIELPLKLAAGHAFVIDGKEFTFPVTFGEMKIASEGGIKPRTLVLPGATGRVVIEGKFSVLVQDQRKWKADKFSIRLAFPTQKPALTSVSLELAVRGEPYQSTPVSLRAAANRAFRDEVADDGKGGWSDQGPGNDMSPLKPGTLTASGVTFEVIDPAANENRSVLVLGGAEYNKVPHAATIPVAGKPVWRSLYLLHAGAWLPSNGGPVGKLTIRYADGSESTQELRAERDLGNWWAPSASGNSIVAWTGENQSSPVGLLASRFPVEAKPVAAVELTATGVQQWMVVAMSGSPDEIPLVNPERPVTIAPGRDWAEYKHETDIEPGSVFDFSAMADAPAGKYGALVVNKSGQFEFANRPGVRVKFWGVNTCFTANYLEKEEADRLADRLVRSGYNTLRIHHFDGALIKKSAPSWELDPVMLDKLDYFFAALKKRGIYINIDLYTIRRFSPEELAAFGLDPKSNASDVQSIFKALIPISQPAVESWQKYSRNLLTHRNPYTGMTWAEDPALIGICPVNEDTLSARYDKEAGVKKRYEELFATWWAKPENRLSGESKEVGFNRFIAKMEIESDQRLHAFLRSLGVKALLTGANYREGQSHVFVRAPYDYVDNHQYMDHPQFPARPWGLPYQFSQTDTIRFAAGTPRGIMSTRIFGRPFVVTEFNFVRPNRHRSEGGVIMPAYASLQDWDAIYNFDYSSSRESINQPGVGGTFSIGSDPIAILADRISAVVFLRGDIAPASGSVAFAASERTAFLTRERSFPEFFSRLGLVTKIGSLPGDAAAVAAGRSFSAVVADSVPGSSVGGTKFFAVSETLSEQMQQGGILPKGSIDAGNRRYVSETGQITLDADQSTCKVVTPRSELFALAPNKELDGKSVAVKNGSTFGSVMVVAVDNKPVAESARLLIAHLTNALPSGMQFRTQEERLVDAWGKGPHLVQRGGATITLRLDPAGTYQAWVLDATGKRRRELPLKQTAAGWELQAETVDANGAQLAYEVARR